jgi:hypothetical protein
LSQHALPRDVIRVVRRPRRDLSERAVCLVLRFPDSTEIHYVDEPPELGARVRSDTGRDWFVAEVLQSGRNTYTVLCVGRDEFLKEVGTPASKRRVLADDVVTFARRSIAGERGVEDELADPQTGLTPTRRKRELRRYLATMVDPNGRTLAVIDAASAADAEWEAQEVARQSGSTVEDVRLWEQADVHDRGPRSPADWVRSLLHRRSAFH